MEVITNIISVFVVLGLVATWWFWKKQPNKTYMIGSIIGTIVAFIVFGIFYEIDKSQKKDTIINTPKSEVSSLSTTSTKKTIPTESSEEVPESTIPSSSEDKYTDEKAKEFGIYLTERLNQLYAAEGYTFSVLASDVTNFVTVPQEMKYFSSTEKQIIADDMMVAIRLIFREWAEQNGISITNEADIPYLILRSPDDVYIAEEEGGILDKRSMSVK